MTGLFRWWTASWGLLAAATGHAEPTVSDLESRVRVLEERLGESRELEALHPVWKNGLRLQSADQSTHVEIGGFFQTDWIWMTGEGNGGDEVGPLEDGTELRRGRLSVAGRFNHRFEFKAEYDFAPGAPEVKDLYLGADLAEYDWIRIGHMKEPLGLEELTSDRFLPFLERSLPTVLVPSRNAGLMLGGHALEARMTAAVGVFRDTDDSANGAGDGHYAVTARLTGLPWSDASGNLVHLGAGGSLRQPAGDVVQYAARPESHMAPKWIATGELAAEEVQLLSAEAAVIAGPVWLQADAIQSTVTPPEGDKAVFSGYDAMAGWMMTGERRAFKKKPAVFDRWIPRRSVGEGGWGAWEVAVRYSTLDFDDGAISGGRLTNLSLALNGYLTPNLRWMLEGILGDAEDRGEFRALQTRIQVDF